MITRDALKQAMAATDIKHPEPVIRFFEDVVDAIDEVHLEGPKPWQEDAEITYSAWQWDLICAYAALLTTARVFVLVGLAEVWDFPEPWGYQGMGDKPVDPADIPGTLRLRLSWAVDKTALRLFNSGGIQNKADRR